MNELPVRVRVYRWMHLQNKDALLLVHVSFSSSTYLSVETFYFRDLIRTYLREYLYNFKCIFVNIFFLLLRLDLGFSFKYSKIVFNF